MAEIDALLLAGVDVLIRKELLPLLKGEPGQGVKDAGGAFQLRGLARPGGLGRHHRRL